MSKYNLNKYIIYTDGASRSNPGHAAAAFIIKDMNGNTVAGEGIYLGIASNNIAEYSAVKLALLRFIKDYSIHLPTAIELRADSLLVVNQLSGIYKVKNAELKEIYEEVKILEKQIGDISYVYIPRRENALTDKLANQALDAHLQKI